jgi:hypothetical protein
VSVSIGSRFAVASDGNLQLSERDLVRNPGSKLPSMDPTDLDPEIAVEKTKKLFFQDGKSGHRSNPNGQAFKILNQKNCI